MHKKLNPEKNFDMSTKVHWKWKTLSSSLSIVSLLVVFVAVYYYYNYQKSLETQQYPKELLDQILSGLLRAEQKVNHVKPRVALGLGGCLDIIVNAIKLFEKLDYSPPTKVRHHSSLQTPEQLQELFAYFFQFGAAAERYVNNDTFFEELWKNANSIKGRQWFLGGNALSMAQRLVQEGAEVLLGMSHSKKLRALLPPEVKVAGPNLVTDDIHLILEYNKGDNWGSFTSPRANRLILHSDNSNPQLEALENFQEQLDSFQPSLLVLGGLQMMDNFPYEPGERTGRLNKVQEMLSSLPRKTKVHFEFASFTDMDLLHEIMAKVIIYADSIGLNEQELPNLVTLLNDGSVTVVSDSYPRIATVLDQMRFVYSHLQNSSELEGRRRLTRLHVHTIAFQAILTDKSSTWKNSMSATAKAALTAHRHVCGSADIDTLKARILMDDSFSTSKLKSAQRIPLQKNRPVSCWDEDRFQICIAPVLVCTKVQQTAGGGDNISSAGLVLQV